MSQLNVDTIKKADGTGNLSVPAETGTVVTTASPSLGRRNLIINGAMQVAQRGNQTALTGGFACDRFNVVEGSATAVVNVNKSTDSTDGFSNSMQVDVTTEQASIGATEVSYVRYKIEGQDIQHLKYGTASAQSVTLSFWVKSSVTGTYVANLYSNDATKINRQTYIISTADTWEYKTLTFSGDTSSGFDNDNNGSLSVHWVLATGTDYTGGSLAADTWGSYTNSEFATGQTANVLNDTANNFYLTGVQLEVGSVATPFEHRSYGEELALCQRYYQQLGRTSSDAGAIVGMVRNTHFTSGFFFTTSMRAAPTGVAYGSNSTSGTIQIVFGTTTDTGHTANSSDVRVELLSTEAGRFRVLSTSGPNGGGAYVDLGTGSSQVGITLDAEL